MADNQSITIPVGTSLRDAERRMIEATLRFTSGNIAGAARVLQIDRGTLYGKMRKHQLDCGTATARRAKTQR
ncbi:MAG TPA: helix-turn-helix domain-containing protein [Bryobacteraceae bacterium]|jgi:DNA-binding NtrC family response regulator